MYMSLKRNLLQTFKDIKGKSNKCILPGLTVEIHAGLVQPQVGQASSIKIKTVSIL